MIIGDKFIDLIHLDTKGNSNIWVYQILIDYNKMNVDIRYEELIVKRNFIKLSD